MIDVAMLVMNQSLIVIFSSPAILQAGQRMLVSGASLIRLLLPSAGRLCPARMGEHGFRPLWSTGERSSLVVKSVPVPPAIGEPCAKPWQLDSQ